MYFISQIGEQDCAFACLKMMLANYHHDRNYLYLPCDKDKSYSYADLISYAGRYNLTLSGIKVSTNEELANCKTFPFIATLQKKKDVRHSVLVLKANRKHVTIYDPASGKKKMGFEYFCEIWTGRALILKEVVPTKCPDVYPDFISKKDKIILPILQVLSGVSLLLGTYFISGSEAFYLPIIFFGLFFVFEILFRKSLVDAMRHLDENIFSYSFKKGVNYYETYKVVEKYHYLALSSTTSIIYSILISVFISVILVINDVYNVIYVAVPFALSLIEHFLYKPFFKEKNVILLEKEEEIKEMETDFTFKMKVDETHDLAYNLGMSKNILTYLEVAMLLLSIILTMVLTSSINITYVVFYLCITVLLKTNFVKLLECSTHDTEFDFVRTSLLSSLELENKD